MRDENVSSYSKKYICIFLITALLLTILMATTTTSCAKNKTNSQPKKQKMKKIVKPLLAVAGSWSLDNQTHQEPMRVLEVTAKSANTLFVALIASDSGQGPERGGPPLDGKVQSVEGGGLKWTRRAEAHLSITGEPGIAEIWTAFAAAPMAPFTLTVTRNNDNGVNTLADNYSGGSGPDVANGMVFVQAITGADPKNPIGATAIAGVGKKSGRTTAASVTLTTTRAGSLIEAVGSDWSHATPRTLPAGQVMLHEDVSTPNGDDYWAQGLTAAVATPSSASLSVTAPTDSDCNIVAVEILQTP